MNPIYRSSLLVAVLTHNAQKQTPPHRPEKDLPAPPEPLRRLGDRLPRLLEQLCISQPHLQLPHIHDVRDYAPLTRPIMVRVRKEREHVAPREPETQGRQRREHGDMATPAMPLLFSHLCLRLRRQVSVPGIHGADYRRCQDEGEEEVGDEDRKGSVVEVGRVNWSSHYLRRRVLVV